MVVFCSIWVWMMDIYELQEWFVDLVIIGLKICICGKLCVGLGCVYGLVVGCLLLCCEGGFMDVVQVVMMKVQGEGCYKYLVLVLFYLGWCVFYIDCVVIIFVVIQIVSEFVFKFFDFGILLLSFFFGYFFL